MNDTKEIGFSNKFENAVQIAEQAKSVVVTNAEQHKAAGALIEQVRGLEKELEAEYKSHAVIVEAKKLQAMKGDLAELLETARKTAKARQIAYEDEQEAIRRAEEVRLAAEAKKQAEEAALAEAKAAQEAGDKDGAIAVLEQAIAAPAPTVVLPKTAPKTANRRTVRRFRITNEALIPRDYLSPDLTKIGGVVRSLGLSAKIPGVEVYEETV